jgi:hypothetical protein
MEIIEITFIVLLVILQVFVFASVWRKIIAYSNYFPNSFKEIQIKRFGISKSIINDTEQFTKFIDSIGTDTAIVSEDDSDIQQVELLVAPDSVKHNHKEFNDVIKSTNAYLCKNKGASADFNILQDVCDRHLQKLDNEISNLINVPLYIGLAGTFLGIIIGLWGIDVSATETGSGTVISASSISQLLNGVISAMVASLVGLAFTVWNTALNYKPAAYQNDTDKNHYYDFLQRELLPVLNVGVAGSLTSFKSVLNHFIQRFGENIGDYKDTAHLLNDNLQKQQLVLAEINKLSIAKTAVTIAEVFAGLKESSEHLNTFKQYQKSLNENIEKSDNVVQNINTTIDQFKDFNTNLKAISNNTLTSIELQKQFKDALEVHFPTISDHREVWRKQVDDLNVDIKEVYGKLNEYFKTSTEQIQNFIGSNNNFFTGINDIQNSIKLFVENSSIQKNEFEILKNEMIGMRNDFKESQSQSIETNKALIEAIKDFNIKLSRIEVVTTTDNNQ